jgi:HTH-type transcriptional regulator/antitoxin HigA
MDNVVRLITNEDDLDRAQAEMGRLLDKTGRTAADEDRLAVLGVLVRSYEDDHWALEMPDPVCAIQSRMDDLGLQQADLLREFGNKTTASLIMGRRRPLTLPIIRRLAARLTLPIAVLAQEYELAADSTPEDALFSAMA